MKKDAINKCQYWSVLEPLQCKYWDEENTVCTYITDASENEDNDNPTHAEYAPYCNLIGTYISCKHYESPSPGEYQPRCVLPDPRRHVCNRDTGYKWVTATGTQPLGDEQSYQIKDWSFDVINGYNDGNCNEAGTDTTCSGYAPYHLGFGILKPSSELDKYDTFKENRYSITDEFGYRLPTNFVVYNIRAVLSKCYHWNASPGVFSVNSNGEVELKGTWACNSSNDTSKYSEFTLENGPPCNGCKPECPYYTGVCWIYCIDEKMEDGDPILAEQIHELRYYHRENMWTMEDFENLFIDDGFIFTWSGDKNDGASSNYSTVKGKLTVTLGGSGEIYEYNIPSVKTWMESFDSFEVKTENVVMTEGTTITKQLKDYPTLIREIQELPLSPVIKNRFGRARNYTSGTRAIGDSDDYLNDTNYFETASLDQNQPLLIYGKTFYTNTIKAINISDKELSSVLPAELQIYENTYDCQNKYEEWDARYDEFVEDLRLTLRAIETLFPEKVASNSIDSSEYTFLMEVPTVSAASSITGTNENVVLVYQDIGNHIIFSKVKFTKRVVGGILSQTQFNLIGDDLPTDLPKDFEQDFFAMANENGSISFDFVPFNSGGLVSTANYIFNDSRFSDPLFGHVYSGHSYYKLTATEFPLEDNEFKVIGSNGYALIDIDDPYLNNLFAPFTVDEIVVTYTLDNPDYTGEEGQEETITKECEMEIVCHGASGLIGPQQLIVKPKQINDLSSACDVYVELRGLTYWEKRSYSGIQSSQEFEAELINSDESITLSNASVSFTGSSFEISDFGGFSMTPTVVINNCEGKPFTLYKTKPIGIVKQPSCPDVEIFYNWSAEYLGFQNKPICKCCGEWDEIDPHVGSDSWTPYCGDHFITPYQRKGPMWWPYNGCLEWDTYEQLTNLNNFSLDVIGLYQLKQENSETGEEEWLHGSHDMRMQGPHNYYGFVGLGCNPLLPCSCMMRSYNKRKTSDNYFTGWAKIRGGIPTSQFDVWQEAGSTMPKFGNAIRPFLRSYRTMDRLPYLNAKGDSVLWKLMPASMMFSKMDIMADEDEMWSWYCSGDGPNVVNPMGFLLARSFDNVSVNEKFDDYNRFRHEEVFRCKWTVDIEYQRTTGDYVRKRGEDTIIVPWYEFKRYPAGGSNDFIQWAWQEPWKDIDRNYKENGSDLTSFIMSYKEGIETNFLKGPFTEDSGTLEGTFQALNVDYPKYLFDFKNKEYRQMLDEGECILYFRAPIKEEGSGEYIGYPSFQIDGGPKRGLSWEGEWLAADNQDGQTSEDDEDDIEDDFNFELYDKCIGDKYKTREVIEYETHEYVWSDDVTLFGEGYTEIDKGVADDDGRMCQTYYFDWPKTITLHTYFQRGLNVSINKGALPSLPLRLANISQFAPAGVSEENGHFIAISNSQDTYSTGFHFDNVKRTLGRLVVSYRVGAEEMSPATEESPATYKYYHKPQIMIYSSKDGLTSNQLLYSTGGMELNITSSDMYEMHSTILEWENDWDYIVNGDLGIYITYRITPNNLEISELNDVDRLKYDNSLNLVAVENISMYEEYLTDAQEKLNLHERKYYVSHASVNDMPPQGEDEDEDTRVLQRRPGPDHSTVWQHDSSEGVNGIPNSDGPMKFMNKVRGRIVKELYKDAKVLEDDLYTLEQQQKKMYDEAYNEITKTSHMTGFLPKPTKELLTAAGVTFQGPRDLELHNSTVPKLATLQAKPQMSGEGHRYQPGAPKKANCLAGDACLDGGRGGDAFLFEYKNQDDYLGDEILTNAVLVTKGADGTYKIGSDGEIVGVSSSQNFRVDTEDTYGTTGSDQYGNPFDTTMTNPIVQLYRGAAWQIERVMMYEALMETVFPAKFNRAPSNDLFEEKDLTGLLFPSLIPVSYGGAYNDSYSPADSLGYEPGATIHWADPSAWQDMGSFGFR